jgi:uridine kinase
VESTDTPVDPNEIEDLKYLEDLFTLLSGGSIINPHTKIEVDSTRFIILDEPFGRSRQRMNEIIDLAVHVEIPLEIALARRLQRQILNDSNPEAFMKFINEYIPNYLYNGYREFYIEVNRIAKQDCDLILDGVNPIENHMNNILIKL